MDSAQDPSILLHNPDGSSQRFQEFSNGLYYYDTQPVTKPSLNSHVTLSASSFVQTYMKINHVSIDGKSPQPMPLVHFVVALGTLLRRISSTCSSVIRFATVRSPLRMHVVLLPFTAKILPSYPGNAPLVSLWPSPLLS
jgi:hypothetical protein